MAKRPDTRPTRPPAPPPPSRLPTPFAPPGFRPPRDDAFERPKPRVGLALVAMAVLFLAVVAGLSVIGFAILSGFRTLSKPRRAEAPLPRVAPLDPVAFNRAGTNEARLGNRRA